MPDNEQIQGVEHIRVAGYGTPTSLFFLKLLDAIYTLRAIKAIPIDTNIIVTNTFLAPIVLPLLRRAKVYADVAGIVNSDTLEGTEKTLQQWLARTANGRHKMANQAKLIIQQRFTVDAMTKNLLTTLKGFAD